MIYQGNRNNLDIVLSGHPTIRPSLNLDFANSQTVDPRITFTRASTATRTNARGLIESVASGAPRIDYDPVTGVCKGLLIEESRTNLLTYSSEFDNAAWTKTVCTIAPDAAASPDGTTTMDKIVVTSAAASSGAYAAQTITKAATATTYTLSYFLKAAEKDGFRIYMRDSATSANYAAGSFNLTTGVANAPGVGGTFTAPVSSIMHAGNGVYRCSLTFTTSTETSIAIRSGPMNSDGTSFTGDGTSGIYIWGAQLEAGAFHTSYIPTTTAAATRAAENASMTGTNFSSWYRQDEGTLSVTCTPAATVYATAGHIVSLSAGTTAEFFLLQRNSSLASSFAITTGNVAQAALTGSTIATGSTVKLAFAAKLNDVIGAHDGTLTTADTASTMPTVTQMHLGSRYDGLRHMTGHIRNLRYYPKRLSNVELQTITSKG